ncbi:CATRA conflict system CASPASE/TPR repeat-associated protein [Spirillospora sp. NPDC029432]|uniref:CATRA conflict system CASPASE/TPR repeat-associated protein n=1 Tax=Spirillospora sp. NPDC029432 TaxID=3154599 RepID=UPI003452A2ED
MGTGESARSGLVVHVFVARSGPAAQEHAERLDHLWSALGSRLGMTVETNGAVSVREAPEEPLRQAVLRDAHDVRCLSVALTGGTWRELAELWEGCAGELDWVLGECRLFVDYEHGQPTPRLTRGVLSALPGAEREYRFTRADRFALWETGLRDGDARRLRVFAVVAHVERERDLDAWLWSSGDDRMSPLARFLMHAAKVRFQLRVYAEGRVFRQARQRVDDQAARVVAALEDDGLLAAHRELMNHQVAPDGLIWTMTRLRDMVRTVEIARYNMRATPLEDDLALADWFRLRIEDDLGYADAARERAREIGAITDLVIRERLQARAETSERRWGRFGVLETAVIGTLLMMLAAVQSLDYKVPVGDAAKPYIVAALGTVAFLLTAFGFVRWRRNR